MPSSQLTRSVFRRLIANKPLVFHRQIAQSCRPKIPEMPARSKTWEGQKRTLFKLLEQKPARDLRDPLLDPGMKQMLELERRIHLVARLPHPEQLASAFNAFVTAKQNRKQPIVDFQVARLLQTFKTLEEDDDQRLLTGQKWWLSSQDLRRALHALSSVPAESTTALHNDLARRVYDRILRLPEAPEDDDGVSVDRFIELARLLQVLCATGDATDARRRLVNYLSNAQWKKELVADSASSWSSLIAGFTKEDNEDEIATTLSLMKENGVAITSQTRVVLTLYYARKDNVEEVRRWFEPQSLNEKREDKRTWLKPAETYRTLLEFCLRNREMEWAQIAFGQIDEAWSRSAILQAAAATGKSVDELDRMLTIMTSRGGKPTVDIAIFNNLIESATQRGDPYIAERYVALALKWDAEPNARTFILQISYRLDTGDYTGAETAYGRLREQLIADQEDWDIMNKMIQVLTTVQVISSDIIMGLVKDLSARKRMFPADTVAALCTYHLHRDEYFELVDLLQTYAYQYNIAERTRIKDLLAQASLNPVFDTARVWDTYMIFHQVFDLETKRDLLDSVMVAMFGRKRPDLAIHVFTRMTRHSRADSRPDHDTYVKALTGIYKIAEPEALDVVHNILKLDTEVEPSTQLRTALMLAYTACGASWRALEIWEEISVSEEGPSHSSLHAVMRACERQAFGYRTANAVWDRLMRSDVEIDAKLFASYVGVLSGNRMFVECGTLIGHMPSTTGQPVDAYTVGTFYNCARGVTYQTQIALWAQDNFPKIWTELEARGIDEDEQGFKCIKGIDRFVEP